MSDIKLVGPPQKPAEVAKANLAKLDEKVAELEQSLLAFGETLSTELDEAFDGVWSTLQVMLLVQGGLLEAVKALSADPGNPHSSATKAAEIITEMEEAYGPDAGQSDDGVVPEAEGHPTGDS